jgi:hypothetical protein
MAVAVRVESPGKAPAARLNVDSPVGDSDVAF